MTGPDGFDETVTFEEFEQDTLRGLYTFEDVPVGEYLVEETNADGLIANYALKAEASVTSVSVTVSRNAEATAVLVNKYHQELGNLRIVKTFHGLNGADREILNDLMFTVTGVDSRGDTVFPAKTYAYADFSESGILLLSDVPAGTYTVTEENAEGLVSGYVLDSTQVYPEKGVTVEAGKTGTLYVANTYRKNSGTLILRKTFPVNEQTKDTIDTVSRNMVTFDITGPDGYSKTVTYGEFTSSGTYTITDLPLGEYTVTEYNQDTSRTYVFLADASSELTQTAVLDQPEAVRTVSFVNRYERDTGTLKITKIWTGADIGKLKDNLVIAVDGPDYHQAFTYKSAFDASGVLVISGLKGTSRSSGTRPARRF